MKYLKEWEAYRNASGTITMKDKETGTYLFLYDEYAGLGGQGEKIKRMVTAAPKMLAALKEAQRNIAILAHADIDGFEGEHNGLDDVWIMIDKAIAAATIEPR